MTEAITGDIERVRQMAERLDCFLEEDFRALTLTTPKTVEEWRKRGKVAYVLIGNRYLYPRQAVQEFVASNLRERASVPIKAVL
jgi:hypothetical protein